MTVRRMTVVRSPGTMDTPMVKIANQLLETIGFNMGTPIEVTYRQGEIVIKTLRNQYGSNQLQQPAGPITNSTASDTADTKASAGNERVGESNPRSSAPAVYYDVKDLCGI
jgi:hypothetical protein